MTAPELPHRTTSRAPRTFAASVRRLGRPALGAVGLVVLSLGMAGVGLAGCGSPSEGGSDSGDDGDDATVPAFGGDAKPGDNQTGAMGNGLCTPGATTCVDAQTLGTCNATGTALDTAACAAGQVCNAGRCAAPGSNNSEPGTGPVPIAQSCTPNSVTCQGNVLQRCNAEGTAITPEDCGASGGSCVVDGGTAACAAAPAACTPGEVSCETANTVATCGADGTVTTSRCPNGSNCEGGQCVPVQCNPAGMLSSGNGAGGITVYWFAQGTIVSVPRNPDEDVNCGFQGSRADNDDGGQSDRVQYIQDPALFGAINTAQYNGSAACGACVEISPVQGGQPTVITVADRCPIETNPTCTNGHIDLSRAAFGRVTGGQTTGDINGVTWRFVPCDSVDNVQFILKEPANEYWNQFVVVNHKYPLARAEVMMADGTWVEARRELYNYWTPIPPGGPEGSMGTYRVRVTDINGAIIEEQLELRAGPQGGSGQFDCQP